MRNRNLNTRPRSNTTRPRSNMGWIAGAVVVLLLLGGLVMFWSPDPVNTASNTNASSPATTGSAPARPATPAR